MPPDPPAPAAPHPPETPETDTVEAELRATAAADPAEIDRLFRENNDALLRFVAAKLGSAQEAKEVAQEAYVRLLSLDHREAVSYLRAFLYKTAANLAIDRLRQRARRGFVVSSHSVDLAPFDLSPDRQLEGEVALQRLGAAIEELPGKCREAFLLYRLEGLSRSAVARRMGLQERMVSLYIARALEYLRVRVHGEIPSAQHAQQEVKP